MWYVVPIVLPLISTVLSLRSSQPEIRLIEIAIEARFRNQAIEVKGIFMFYSAARCHRLNAVGNHQSSNKTKHLRGFHSIPGRSHAFAHAYQ